MKAAHKKQISFHSNVQVSIYDAETHFQITEGVVLLESSELRTLWHLNGQVCPGMKMSNVMERLNLLGHECICRIMPDKHRCSTHMNNPVDCCLMENVCDSCLGMHKMTRISGEMESKTSHAPEHLPFAVMLQEGIDQAQRYDHEWVKILTCSSTAATVDVRHSVWVKLDVGLNNLEARTLAEAMLQGWNVQDVTGHWLRSSVADWGHEVLILTSNQMIDSSDSQILQIPWKSEVPITGAENRIAVQGWSQCSSLCSLAFAGVTDEWIRAEDHAWSEDSFVAICRCQIGLFTCQFQ